MRIIALTIAFLCLSVPTWAANDAHWQDKIDEARAALSRSISGDKNPKEIAQKEQQVDHQIAEAHKAGCSTCH